MACETPVVASAVGGIKEVVIPGETGLLVPFEPISRTNFEPRDPARFVHDLAAGVNQLLDDPQRLREMGLQSRDRVERHFSWSSIARRTLDFYSDLVHEHAPSGAREVLISSLARSTHARSRTAAGPWNSIGGRPGEVDARRRSIRGERGILGRQDELPAPAMAEELSGSESGPRASEPDDDPERRSMVGLAPEEQRVGVQGQGLEAARVASTKRGLGAAEPEQGLVEPERRGVRLAVALGPVDLAGQEGLLGLESGIFSSWAGSANAA